MFMLIPLVITSPFGPRVHPVTGHSDTHTGIDIRCDHNVIFASRFGTVQRVWNDSVNGHAMRIEHDKYISGFAHLSEIYVNIGDEIMPGMPIAVSGATGRVTGPHLHFGIERNGRWIDPEPIIRNTYSTVAILGGLGILALLAK
jgi:murein DD-endopeptidase MepM/ murein hydrolase activator NlpD